MPRRNRVGDGRNERQPLATESGQALIEFALILPVLLILILGVVDLGRALGYKNDQTNLANQAARLAVVSGGTSCTPCGGSSIADYIIGTAPPELRDGTGSISHRSNGHGIEVSFTFPEMNGQPGSPCPNPPTTTACGYCAGSPVQVNVLSTYNFLSFLIGQHSLPLSHDMSSSATMRMESSYDPTTVSPVFTPTNNMTGAKPCPTS